MRLLAACHLVVCLWTVGIVAPIPPCSRFSFINQIVESDELSWLAHDLPGHPVAPDCPYPSRKDAPLEEKSLLYYLIKDPNRIVKEIRDETTWFADKGLSRIVRRFWNNWDEGTGNKKTGKFY